MTDANQVRGNRLDPWLDSYAARAHGLRASETRSLFAVASRPEVVSLAGGMPNLKDLPLDRLADATAQMIRKDGGRALQYGNGQGLPALREKIPQIMALEGIDADPEDIIVTTGSQQAVDIITELFIDPGDVILAEAPTYVGSLSIFSTYQADVQHVAIDADGVIPEALEERITQLEREGRSIKFFYCLPNFHNPAGVTLSEERRPQVIEICRRHHILIVEDNPRVELHVHRPHGLDADRVADGACRDEAAAGDGDDEVRHPSGGHDLSGQLALGLTEQLPGELLAVGGSLGGGAVVKRGTGGSGVRIGHPAKPTCVEGVRLRPSEGGGALHSVATAHARPVQEPIPWGACPTSCSPWSTSWLPLPS